MRGNRTGVTPRSPPACPRVACCVRRLGPSAGGARRCSPGGVAGAALFFVVVGVGGGWGRQGILLKLSWGKGGWERSH
eukprot:gene19109-biopygen10006